MADFCKTCSEEIFGTDFKELAGIITEEAYNNGKGRTFHGICEGCGPVYVDHEGHRVKNDEELNKWVRY